MTPTHQTPPEPTTTPLSEASASTEASAPTESGASTETSATTEINTSTPITAEVAVVGGGAAGLAAAIALARSLRRVVVIDAGHPRNRTSAHAHNLLGNEGINPLDLVDKGRAEAESYGVTFVDDMVITAIALDGGSSPAEATASGRATNRPAFALDTAGMTRVEAQHLILATGLTDELPDIPGLAEGWGDTVLHCPYCHGYEVRGQRIAAIGTTVLSYHQAMMFSQLSDHIMLLRHEAPAPTEEQAAMLRTLGIEFVDARVDGISRNGATTELTVEAATTSALDSSVDPTASEAESAQEAASSATDTTVDQPASATDSTDGSSASRAELAEEATTSARELTVDAIAVGPFFRANSELFEQLGGTVVEDPSGMGSTIPTDPTGRTDIPGVWAVGNSADMSAMIGASAASGVKTGAMVNYELIQSRLAREE